MSFLLAALGAAAAATVVLGAMMLVQRRGAGSGPTIAGLAEMPGGVPVVGNLLQLGTEHARVARRWGRHLGPVFQARLGAKVSRLAALRRRMKGTDEVGGEHTRGSSLSTRTRPPGTSGSATSRH